MADGAKAPAVEQTTEKSPIEIRMENWLSDVEIHGECDKCSATGQFSWTSRALATNGQTMTGACRRCAGKGFLTNADVRRNSEYDNYRLTQAKEIVAQYTAS